MIKQVKHKIIIMVVLFFTLLPLICAANCVVDALGPGQYNDLLLQYYQDNGATSGSLQDAEYEFLIAQGMAPASNQDMWYEFLSSLGYSGGLSDMLWSFWCIDDGQITPEDGYEILVDNDGVTIRDSLGERIVVATNIIGLLLEDGAGWLFENGEMSIKE